MARYRLMLLDAPPPGSLDALARALPSGVDAVDFAALCGQPFTHPAPLGSGDNLGLLEVAVTRLQALGLAASVVDDGTTWSRLGEVLSKPIRLGPPPADEAAPRDATLRSPSNPALKRLALFAAAVALVLTTLALSSRMLAHTRSLDDASSTAGAEGESVVYAPALALPVESVGDGGADGVARGD
jgi:hypothetical protein